MESEKSNSSQSKDISRITPRSENFAEWYQDIIAVAELAEHSGIKGSMIIKPYGYAIWELIQDILDKKIKETGHKNAYFPLLIPESYLKKEKEHVEGFSPELAVVTHAGGEKLEEPLVVRPTSETIINATFSKWIQSWRDLPLLINQWANVVRWELRPRLFLRTSEFLWQEGHTAHASKEEAEDETLKMLDVYKDVAENYLAMPVITGKKTETEKFAGGDATYAIEAMMLDGKALQAGTSHFLGQNFAKAFDVMFTDKDGERKYVWQSSWGVTTRLIGGVVMTHSDDKGLVLPPQIAPIQVVIIPITKTEEEQQNIFTVVDLMRQKLEDHHIRVEVDYRDQYTVGYKFNEWEKKGVPVRIEIGPRDAQANQAVVVRRDTGEKQTIDRGDIDGFIMVLLSDIQKNLFYRARTFREEHTHKTDDYGQFKQLIEDGNFVVSHWCGESTCEKAITTETKATIRCIPFDQENIEGKCLKCGMESKETVVFAKAY